MDKRQKVSKPAAVDGKKKGSSAAYFALLFSLVSLIGVGSLVVLGHHYIKTGNFTFFPLSKQSPNIDSNGKTVLEDKRINGDGLSLLEQQYLSLDAAIRSNQERIKQNQIAFNKVIKGRYDWLLDEVEYGLGLVTLQLLNTGNTESASRSLSHMKDRLENFDSPDLQPLKKSLAEAISSLKQADLGNVSDALVNIDLLLNKVDDLPFLADRGFSPEKKAGSAVAKTSPSFSFEHLWQEFLQAIRSGVQVRHLHRVDALLLSPEQIFFVKENIKLRLLTARLSLLQRNEESYLQQLSVLEDSVKEYFELKAPVVQDFLNTLSELKEVKLAPIDLSAIRAAGAAIKSLQSRKLTEEAEGIEEENPTVHKENASVRQKKSELEYLMPKGKRSNKNMEESIPTVTSVQSPSSRPKKDSQPENKVHTLPTEIY